MDKGTEFDFGPIEVMTFDCYGTLIDWESGILGGLRACVGPGPSDDELLEAYASAELAAEAGPYIPYRRVLGVALCAVASKFGTEVSRDEKQRFGGSVADWPAFPDSAGALSRLRGRFQLGVITNCDDDLFAASNRRLGQPFTWTITAELARSYKPASKNFEVALERIGRPRESILHVAQSLFHDHVPAQAMGLATAWIDRRAGRDGFGATPRAEATPNVIALDMVSFSELALA